MKRRMSTHQGRILSANLPRLSCIAGAVLLAFSGNSLANSFNISYGQLKQHVTFINEATTLKPVGPSLGLSYDLNEQWSVDFGYNKWSDGLTLNDAFTADSDLKTWGTSVNYYRDKWSFSLSYNDSGDDTYLASVRRPDDHNRSEKTNSTAWGATAGYGWVNGNVFYNVSFGAQVADWDSTTVQVTTQQPPPPPPPPPGGGGGGGNEPPPPPPPEPRRNVLTELNSGDSSSVSTSFSVARFWSLTESTGVLLGGMLSWNHNLSGDSVLVSSNGRNNPPPNRPRANNGPGGGNQGIAGGAGGNNFNRAGNNTGISSVSGDDSYGQVSVYISYDLTESWSIDLDTGIDIGTDENDQVWSLSLGYFF